MTNPKKPTRTERRERRAPTLPKPSIAPQRRQTPNYLTRPEPATRTPSPPPLVEKKG